MIIRDWIRHTGPSVWQDGVERVERVGRAGDVGVAPKFLSRQFEHLAENGGSAQVAGKRQWSQAGLVDDAHFGLDPRVSQSVAVHFLFQPNR